MVVFDTSLKYVLLYEGAEEDYTLVWVNRPSKYGQAGAYVDTANHKPPVETVQVAAAVIVDIPAFGFTGRNEALP